MAAGVAILLGGLGYWQQVGIFDSVNIYNSLLYSAVSWIVAMNLFNVEAIRAILDFLKLAPNEVRLEYKANKLTKDLLKK